ncbi:MAG: hypothetical protein MJA83_07485, partial [Gammaproteobacteria bacterium]|nr:hypothetical protein [Gammaproteobacteria bacterium]
VFDGFEPWVIGVIDLRFAKARVIIDHSTGTGLLEGMRLFFDVPERIEQAKSVPVPVGGLSIAFEERFHTTPTIQVQAKPDAGALRIASYDNETESGFDVRIFDPAGTDTGGELQFWRATGG